MGAVIADVSGILVGGFSQEKKRLGPFSKTSAGRFSSWAQEESWSHFYKTGITGLKQRPFRASALGPSQAPLHQPDTPRPQRPRIPIVFQEDWRLHQSPTSAGTGQSVSTSLKAQRSYKCICGTICAPRALPEAPADKAWFTRGSFGLPTGPRSHTYPSGLGRGLQ